MKQPRQYSMHFQDVWRERTANSNLPNWLRVAFLAYGSHQANGHATFDRGDIAAMLGGGVDEVTGEIRLAPRQRVSEAIRAAIREAYLAEGSNSRCLIVPGHAIEKHNGNVNARCDRHATPKARTAGRPLRAGCDVTPQP